MNHETDTPRTDAELIREAKIIKSTKQNYHGLAKSKTAWYETMTKTRKIYEEGENTRSDACPHCGEQGARIRNTHKGPEWFYDCGTHLDAGESYKTLACSRISEIRDLKAEVERLRALLLVSDLPIEVVNNHLDK